MAGIELLFVFLSLSYIPEIDFLTCHMQFRTPAHWCVSEHNSVRSAPLLFDSTWMRPDENIQVLLVQVRILFFYHIISLTSVQIYRCSFTISRSRGTSGSLFAPSSYSYPAFTTREASWIRYFVCHSALIGIFAFVTFSQVLYLFIVETLNTCFDIMLIYEPLITRYGVPFVSYDSISLDC